MKHVYFLVSFATFVVLDRVQSEVVANFSTCSGFFYENEEPQGFDDDRYRKICQKYNKTYTFATLYDSQMRIPTYSAYIISRYLESNFSKKCRKYLPWKKWKVEPQLSFQKGSSEAAKPKNSWNLTVLKKHQAVTRDYIGSGYERGHLNPCSHQRYPDVISTYTLTNAVPQVGRLFNAELWAKLEAINLKISKKCSPGRFFIITGAVPSDGNWIPEGTSRVNVPKSMWTAACCKKEKGFAYGFLAKNKVYPTKRSGNETKAMEITELQRQLQQEYDKKALTLFKNECKHYGNSSMEIIAEVNKGIGEKKKPSIKVGQGKGCPGIIKKIKKKKRLRLLLKQQRGHPIRYSTKMLKRT